MWCPYNSRVPVGSKPKTAHIFEPNTMRASFLSISALALAVSACSDSTAPAHAPVMAGIVQVAASAPLQGNGEEIAAAFDDAASRLTLSFVDNETSASLREALVSAASSFRDGDMGEASNAIVTASSALALIDAKDRNPDAAAIRLVLRYASSATPTLADQRR